MEITSVSIEQIDLWLNREGYDHAKFSLTSKEILQELILNGPKQRSDLIKSIQKPRTTVHDGIVRFLVLGWIKKYTILNHKRGRPPVFFKANIDEHGKPIDESVFYPKDQGHECVLCQKNTAKVCHDCIENFMRDFNMV